MLHYSITCASVGENRSSLSVHYVWRAKAERNPKFLLESVEDWLAGPFCLTGKKLIAALNHWLAVGDHYSECRNQMLKQLNPQIASVAPSDCLNYLLFDNPQFSHAQ